MLNASPQEETIREEISQTPPELFSPYVHASQEASPGFHKNQAGVWEGFKICPQVLDINFLEVQLIPHLLSVSWTWGLAPNKQHVTGVMAYDF